MPRRLLPLFFFLLLFTARAHEGMWLPTLLKGIEADLSAAGLRISTEDIYSLNRGSIKDAVLLFGGGCTGEVVSDQGLILTNHHCGYGRIQAHSSLQSDYLRDGFWAATKADELRNPGLTATFVVRMEDVSDRILPMLDPSLDEPGRRAMAALLSEPIVREAMEGTHFRAVVRPFNHGNAYYLIVTETFRDVRLVGAPPSAIGKFGGDTDNWMWPRHTGDFSLFRIYAGPDNKPADPSDDNVPFKPRHVLPISLDGPQEGEFAMIFGFPGSTQRYLTSDAVRYTLETQDPLRIAMRRASLGVIDPAMRGSDQVRIQYAAKQASISNAYKKWIGEVRGLKELGTVGKKVALEAEYRKRASTTGQPRFAAALDSIEALYRVHPPYAKARDLHIEFFAVGPELLRFADRFALVVSKHDSLARHGKLAAETERLRNMAAAHFKNYDKDVDRGIFLAQLPIYLEHMEASLVPQGLVQGIARHAGKGATTDQARHRFVMDLYARSVFADQAALEDLLARFTPKNAMKLAKDPAFTLSRSFTSTFAQRVRPVVDVQGDRLAGHMRVFTEGLMALFPEKTHWPDANGTLRLSYGAVEGSEPRDAVVYETFTSLDGVMEKHVPGDAEFDVPQRLIELHRAKDYGRYGVDGTMPVCFTSSLHTTGGNSGSPVLNGRGELIGLNFDRSWESTMSDIEFDPAKCRNISVDLRYVLFITDKFAGAGHLVEEMTLVKAPELPVTIQLPIHR